MGERSGVHFDKELDSDALSRRCDDTLVGCKTLPWQALPTWVGAARKTRRDGDATRDDELLLRPAGVHTRPKDQQPQQ